MCKNVVAQPLKLSEFFSPLPSLMEAGRSLLVLKEWILAWCSWGWFGTCLQTCMPKKATSPTMKIYCICSPFVSLKESKSFFSHPFQHPKLLDNPLTSSYFQSLLSLVVFGGLLLTVAAIACFFRQHHYVDPFQIIVISNLHFLDCRLSKNNKLQIWSFLNKSWMAHKYHHHFPPSLSRLLGKHWKKILSQQPHHFLHPPSPPPSLSFVVCMLPLSSMNQTKEGKSNCNYLVKFIGRIQVFIDFISHSNNANNLFKKATAWNRKL